MHAKAFILSIFVCQLISQLNQAAKGGTEKPKGKVVKFFRRNKSANGAGASGDCEDEEAKHGKLLRRQSSAREKLKRVLSFRSLHKSPSEGAFSDSGSAEEVDIGPKLRWTRLRPKVEAMLERVKANLEAWERDAQDRKGNRMTVLARCLHPVARKYHEFQFPTEQVGLAKLAALKAKKELEKKKKEARESDENANENRIELEADETLDIWREVTGEELHYSVAIYKKEHSAEIALLRENIAAYERKMQKREFCPTLKQAVEHATALINGLHPIYFNLYNLVTFMPDQGCPNETTKSAFEKRGTVYDDFVELFSVELAGHGERPIKWDAKWNFTEANWEHLALAIDTETESE